MTALDALRNAEAKLTEAGIEDAKFDAEQIVLYVCDMTSSQLRLNDEEISRRKLDRIDELCEKRIARYPLQYLVEEWEFYSLPFKVGEGVLVPRPETELLVDTAIDYIGDCEGLKIIDLCSGTGCVAVAVAKNIAGCEIYALEKYDEAYEYLCDNIKLNDADVEPIQGDIFVEPDLKYDLILSNPPYIPSDDVKKLQTEVTFEPTTALNGGGDGLDFYRAIAEKWIPCLNDGGAVIVEIGFDERDGVTEIFSNAGLTNIECKKDLSGLDRVIIGTMNGGGS